LCTDPHSSTPPSCRSVCNDPAPTSLYTLSLHDALPILPLSLYRLRWDFAIVALAFLAVAVVSGIWAGTHPEVLETFSDREFRRQDRKSTRLNSSHVSISYAVFCLKKKKQKEPHR